MALARNDYFDLDAAVRVSLFRRPITSAPARQRRSRMPKHRTPGWVCCFCARAIPDLGEESDEPIILDARGARDQTSQTFFAHLRCLKRVVHNRIPVELPRRPEEEEFGVEPQDEP